MGYSSLEVRQRSFIIESLRGRPLYRLLHRHMQLVRSATCDRERLGNSAISCAETFQEMQAEHTEKPHPNPPIRQKADSIYLLDGMQTSLLSCILCGINLLK